MTQQQTHYPVSGDQAPDWFFQAINTPHKKKSVDVDGTAIAYLQWGDNSKPLLVLVHGNGGHANWWDFIAPAFMDDYCVIAPHLVGMGNSGHVAEYHFDVFARGVMAVVKDAGYEQNVTVIGHSMGGVVAMRCAEDYAKCIKALIIIDTPLIFKRADDPEDTHKPAAPSHYQFKGKKYYESLEVGLSRFKLIPPQPCKNNFLVEHVGKHSLRQSDEGWSWKFDGGIYTNFKRQPERPPFDIKNIQCPLAYIHGGKSALVPEVVFKDIKELLKDKGPTIVIADAHHHVLLDEPLELIDKIKKILSGWN